MAFEALSNHSRNVYTIYEYTHFLSTLLNKRNNQSFHSDGQALSLVGKVGRAIQTIRGFFGLTDYTNVVQVERNVLKELQKGLSRREVMNYAGPHRVPELVHSIRQNIDSRSYPFSTTFNEVIQLMDDHFQARGVYPDYPHLQYLVQEKISAFERDRTEELQPYFWHSLVIQAPRLQERVPSTHEEFRQLAVIARGLHEYDRAIIFFQEAGDHAAVRETKLEAGRHAFQNPREVPRNAIVKFFFGPKYDYSQAIAYLEPFYIEFERHHHYRDIQINTWVDDLIRAYHLNRDSARAAQIATSIAHSFDDATKERQFFVSHEERKVHIAAVRPQIEKACHFYALAAEAEPQNPEHYFKRACLLDYLYEVDPRANSLPDYLRAYNLNSNNSYYLWGVKNYYTVRDDNRTAAHYDQIFHDYHAHHHTVLGWYYDYNRYHNNPLHRRNLEV